MGFLKDLADEKIIRWDEERYRKQKAKSDRKRNAVLLPRLYKQTVPWTAPDYDGNGGTEERLPDYPREVLDWVDRFQELELGTEEYEEAWRLCGHRDVHELDLEQALDVLCWYVMTERFIPGTLAQGLEDRHLEELTGRVYELTHPEKK